MEVLERVVTPAGADDADEFCIFEFEEFQSVVLETARSERAASSKVFCNFEGDGGVLELFETLTIILFSSTRHIKIHQHE